jgi:transposase
MAKTRRTFTTECKAEAARRISDQGKSLAEVAREFDLVESILCAWKQAFAAGVGQACPGKGNPPTHEEELRRLRSEVKRLTVDRDISINATAFLALGYDLVERHRDRWPVRLMAGSWPSPPAATTTGGEGRRATGRRDGMPNECHHVQSRLPELEEERVGIRRVGPLLSGQRGRVEIGGARVVVTGQIDRTRGVQGDPDA